MESTREIFTTKEVADYLNINAKQVYRLVRAGKIPATRITGKWLFPRSLVREWVASDARKNVAVEPPPLFP